MLKLADRGVMNETLMAMIRQNTRQPVRSEGDVYSLAACNDIGCQRLVEMMDEFDFDDLEALGDYICDTSEKAVRDNIAKLPNGAYKNTMTIDGIGEAIDLVANLVIHDDKITVDYDGSSPKSLKGINVPMAYTTAIPASVSLALSRATFRTMRAPGAFRDFSPGRHDPERALSIPGLLAPRHRPVAAGRRLTAWRKHPSACRRKGRRACGTSPCAAPRTARRMTASSSPSPR